MVEILCTAYRRRASLKSLWQCMCLSSLLYISLSRAQWRNILSCWCLVCTGWKVIVKRWILGCSKKQLKVIVKFQLKQVKVTACDYSRCSCCTVLNGLLCDIIRLHCCTTYVDAAYCYRWSSVVCLSVCLSWSWALHKPLNRSRCCLGCGLGWAQGITY